MAADAEYRCFVGGLSWNTTEEMLMGEFRDFQVTEAKVIMDRESGRSRGFGYVTFADRRSMDDAIDGMNGKEIDGRVITVNVAQPRRSSGGGGERGGGGGGRYSGGDRYGSSGGGGGGYSGGGSGGGGNGECFKCGHPGHWARDCPSSGGGGGPSRSYGGERRGGGSYDGGSRRGGSSYDGDRHGSSSGKYGSSDRYSGGSDRYAGKSGGGSRYESSKGGERGGPYERPGGESRSRDDRY